MPPSSFPMSRAGFFHAASAPWSDLTAPRNVCVCPPPAPVLSVPISELLFQGVNSVHDTRKQIKQETEGLLFLEHVNSLDSCVTTLSPHGDSPSHSRGRERTRQTSAGTL